MSGASIEFNSINCSFPDWLCYLGLILHMFHFDLKNRELLTKLWKPQLDNLGKKQIMKVLNRLRISAFYLGKCGIVWISIVSSSNLIRIEVIYNLVISFEKNGRNKRFSGLCYQFVSSESYRFKLWLVRFLAWSFRSRCTRKSLQAT